MVLVAVSHGTAVAARWHGVRVDTVSKRLRKRGIRMPNGRPTKRALRRYPPRDGCDCPMCTVIKEAEMTEQQVLFVEELETPVVLTAKREDWMRFGVCKGKADVMYPPVAFERKDERIERELAAKIVCLKCGCRTVCLDYALRTRERHGVWGGATERERKRMLAA